MTKEELSTEETQRRLDRALKKSLQMKPIPHKKKVSRIASKIRKAKKSTGK